jgi:[protein-PII] uridylyltransferase
MPSGEFLLNKIRERQEQYAKFHDTPLVAEPHLKEGAGGLRDLHAAHWICEAIGEQRPSALEATETILTARNLLHAVVGRRQDLLNRSRQGEIAERLGWDHAAWMARVVEAGDGLHRLYSETCTRIHEARFDLAPGVVAIRGEARPFGELDGGDLAVGLAIAAKLGLRIPELPVPAPATVDGAALAYALTTGEATIRNLDRCGLLAHLLPELTQTRTLLPDDSVHTFTVFEHTLRVVRNLDQIDPDGFLGGIRALVHDLEPLYLAALMHDVGKRAKDHSAAGAHMTAAVAKRWGLAPQVGELSAWLVREHLLMSRFIRLRDLQNPETIVEFRQSVGDIDRLNLLTLLTWADVKAVNEAAWTPANETFLRLLYERTASVLQEEVVPGVDPAHYRQRLMRQLRHQTGDETVVRAFVDSLPAYYLVSTPIEVVRLHLAMAEKAARGEPSVEIFHRAEVAATEITVCVQDSPGLLSRLLGVFYALDLSVAGIRACTTESDPAVAVDVFTVSFGGRPVPAATCAQVVQATLEMLEGRRTIESILEEKGKDPGRRQSVFTYQYSEGVQGILEIRAPRGRGMPYRFARELSEQGWNIVAARVGQWAGAGAATFYLVDRTGRAPSRESVDLAMA